MDYPQVESPRPRRAVVLVGKSAVAAAPLADMRRLADAMQARHPELAVCFGFSEQGTPTLREALLALARPAVDDILVLPLLVPLEPGFSRWLRTAIARWHAESPQSWGTIRIGDPLTESPLLAPVLESLLAGFAGAPVAAEPPPPRGEGSVVPRHGRRVLVCQGAACNMRGASALWGHLRNAQERLKLRTAGEGTATALTSCLGPCKLAPVIEICPEGTYYGGVTEAALDRIVDEHLLGGSVVEAYAYPADGTKQRLRG